MKTGIELIAEKRDRQVRMHNYTPEWDFHNNQDDQIRMAMKALLDNELIDRSQGKPPYWSQIIRHL